MDIAEYLRSFVLEVSDVDEAAISEEATFEDLGLDSLAFIELKVGLAKRYGVQINPELFASGEINTLGQTAAYVDGLIKKAAPAA